MRTWLERFARCVRERDYDGARPLFDPSVRSFGTVASPVSGLEDLEQAQWRRVWERTRDFAFDFEGATLAADGSFGWAACGWSSTDPSSDGKPRTRHGRATIILRQQASAIRAVHTHFSVKPVPGDPNW